MDPLNKEFRENSSEVYDRVRVTDLVYRDEKLRRTVLSRAKGIGTMLNDRELYCDPRKSVEDSDIRQGFSRKARSESHAASGYR
jgi:hypothetical protein